MRPQGRRISRSVALGIALALATVGCAASEPARAGDGAGEGTPKRGGILRVGLAGDPAGFDMHKVNDSSSLQSLVPVHAQLLRTVPNAWSDLEPDLASKWEPSADGNTWVFTLRPDAKWHDGRPVSADDVVYTVNRLVDPPPGFRGGGAGCVRDIASRAGKVSDSTVQIRLRNPSVSFLQCMAMAYIRILPKHIIEPVDSQEQSRALRLNEAIGAGPFVLKSYERGSSWVMERHNAYHRAGKDGQPAPYLDGVTYYIIPDANTRLSSMRAGQLDVSSSSESLKLSQAKIVQQESGDRVTIKRVVQARTLGMTFNTASGPFQDVRLRRAVHLAANRQAMIEFLHEGDGFLTPPLCACWEYIYPESYYLTRPGYRPDKAEDVKEAKRLVEEATGGKGLDVTLINSNSQSFQDYLPLILQNLAEIGIRVKLEMMENAVAQQLYQQGRFVANGVQSTSVPFMDPDSMISRMFLPTGDRNWGKWSHREFQDLYAKESVLTDLTERGKILKRMADILEAEAPVVGFTEGVRYLPMSSAVRGYEKAPNSGVADQRWDYVWLEK